MRWSKLFPPLLLLRSLTQTKAVISIPFFGHFIVISVHRKVAFYGLFILSRAAFPPLSGAGVDRDHVKKEDSYEKASSDQTAVEGKANGKQPPQIDKQTAVFQRQPVRSFEGKPPARANGTKPRSGFGIVSYTFPPGTKDRHRNKTLSLCRRK